MDHGASAYREIRFTVQDGLTLVARDYGSAETGATPVLCLPGLTRNAKDFHELAMRLAPRRRVLALDFRGRGRSDRAADWRSYTVPVECADVLQLLALTGIGRVVAIGTSRGGLVAMALAAARPTALAGVVLNDVGPVLESEGLIQIRRRLDGATAPQSWADATEAVKAANPGFEDLDEEDWQAFARRLYRDENGRPALDYDPDIARTFPTEAMLEGGTLPPAWPSFMALAGRPVLVVRGANSDLLSAATVTAMQAAMPTLEAVTVPGRAHPPFLTEPEAEAAIDRLLDRIP